MEIPCAMREAGTRSAHGGRTHGQIDFVDDVGVEHGGIQSGATLKVHESTLDHLQCPRKVNDTVTRPNGGHGHRRGVFGEHKKARPRRKQRGRRVDSSGSRHHPNTKPRPGRRTVPLSSHGLGAHQHHVGQRTKAEKDVTIHWRRQRG